MENLPGISEPQVSPNEQKINELMGKMNLLIFFALLVELEVWQYLPSFPYWSFQQTLSRVFAALSI